MTQRPILPVTPDMKLSEAVEQLYEVFAKYPVNFWMSGSPLYSELAQWNQALTAKPLRELSAEEDLRIYYFKAMSTWGDVYDFKHFLPRILELISTLPIDFEEWVALDKLNYGNYKKWPEREKNAVYQFLLALWQKLLREKSDLIDALFEDYFPALANVYPDFSQLLQLWLEADSQQSTQRLASLVCRNTKLLLEKQVLPGFYKSVPRGKLFLEWLRSTPVLNKLKQVLPSEVYPYLDLELIPIIKQLEER